MSVCDRMKPTIEGNPIVFFDVQVGPERVGRMVIELRKDKVPKTAENFRKLCVGDHYSATSKSQLSYTGTRVHKVQRMFAVCGGSIGKIAESIYGPTFPDENFELQHTTGAVSMANYGPNTNNSQFFITSGDCPNLDGTNVVCGYVLRGFGIISEMEKVTTEEGVPTTEITIVKAGELQPDEPWNYYDLDDNLPPFPADWIEAAEYNDREPEEIFKLLDTIKTLGNSYYNDGEAVAALSKYKKVVNYLAHFATKTAVGSSDRFNKLKLENSMNMAACYLRLARYADVISICNDVIRGSPSLSKAFYRRGVAEIELKEYESALADLKQAHSLAPNDKNVLEQFNRGKTLLLEYRKTEKTTSQKMLKDLHL